MDAISVTTTSIEGVLVNKDMNVSVKPSLTMTRWNTNGCDWVKQFAWMKELADRSWFLILCFFQRMRMYNRIAK